MSFEDGHTLPGTSFVYSAQLGTFKDPQTGFLYDAVTKIYTDSSDGSCYTFDKQKKAYVPCKDETNTTAGKRLRTAQSELRALRERARALEQSSQASLAPKEKKRKRESAAERSRRSRGNEYGYTYPASQAERPHRTPSSRETPKTNDRSTGGARAKTEENGSAAAHTSTPVHTSNGQQDASNWQQGVGDARPGVLNGHGGVPEQQSLDRGADVTTVNLPGGDDWRGVPAQADYGHMASQAFAYAQQAPSSVHAPSHGASQHQHVPGPPGHGTIAVWNEQQMAWSAQQQQQQYAAWSAQQQQQQYAAWSAQQQHTVVEHADETVAPPGGSPVPESVAAPPESVPLPGDIPAEPAAPGTTDQPQPDFGAYHPSSSLEDGYHTSTTPVDWASVSNPAPVVEAPASFFPAPFVGNNGSTPHLELMNHLASGSYSTAQLASFAAQGGGPQMGMKRKAAADFGSYDGPYRSMQKDAVVHRRKLPRRQAGYTVPPPLVASGPPLAGHQRLPDANPGTRLMKNMGYVEGRGLGATSDGQIEPVQMHIQTFKAAGIGYRLQAERVPARVPKKEEPGPPQDVWAPPVPTKKPQDARPTAAAVPAAHSAVAAALRRAGVEEDGEDDSEAAVAAKDSVVESLEASRASLKAKIAAMKAKKAQK